MKAIKYALTLVGLCQALPTSFFVRQLAYDSAQIEYSPTLDCISCVRGGFDYCPFDGACVKKAESNMLCSNKFADKINFMYNVCPISQACDSPSKRNFMLPASTSSQLFELFSLQPGQGCLYQVSTVCGYPHVNLTFQNNLASDFDLQMAFGEWNSSNGLNATLFEKTFFQDNDVRTIGSDQVSSGPVAIGKGEDETSFNNCTGP